MFLAGIDDIIKKFKSFEETRVLFSAEQYCWPDTKLASDYPKTDGVNPYLNSGGFIGEYYMWKTYRSVLDTRRINLLKVRVL